MGEQLLELQSADTAADQLAHRRAHLDERTAADTARAAVAAWERRQAELEARLAELTGDIERAERDSGELDQHRSRLTAQLRTVIAPREAEALQHEIQTLTDRRGELDDVELAALEEQASIDDELVAHLAAEHSVREAAASAEAQLTAVDAQLDQEAAELAARRDAARAQLDPALLTEYDRLRAQLGVAVAQLVGHRCDGCHLDLSPAEIDSVRAVPDGELARCPNCSRLLVR